MHMNFRFIWYGVHVRLEFLRYPDGSLVIEAVVDGAQNLARRKLEDGEVFRRITTYVGLGRALGDRNALVALRDCKDNDGIVPALVLKGVLTPSLRRTVPSSFGSCVVYELTDEAQVVAADNCERIEA
jgi:hypothetical protein